jgi:hypothetical protein
MDLSRLNGVISNKLNGLINLQLLQQFKKKLKIGRQTEQVPKDCYSKFLELKKNSL